MTPDYPTPQLMLLVCTEYKELVYLHGVDSVTVTLPYY